MAEGAAHFRTTRLTAHRSPLTPRRIACFAALAGGLAGCAYLPGPAHGTMAEDEVAAALQRFRVDIAEPGANEAVIVINGNAVGGNHAGLFAGLDLLDPAGSYRGVRAQDPRWAGPTLADYVRYQMLDGDNIRIYRFRLGAGDFDALRARVNGAGGFMPFFCAVDVHNTLAGIGPFAQLSPAGWATPLGLAGLLDGLDGGACALPDSRMC
jgi:hypothetical protein